MLRSPIRLMIIDAQPAVRAGINCLLGREVEIVNEASTCAEAKQYLFLHQERLPEVILLDLWVSGVNTFELISHIRLSYPTVAVAVYTAKDEQIFGIPVLQLGASGYISREAPIRDLERAIRAVVNGETVFSRTIKDNIDFQEAHRGRTKGMRITLKELRVLIMIADGLKTAQIMRRLRVTEKTIESHKESLKRKLHLKNTAQLSQRAFLYVYGGSS